MLDQKAQPGEYGFLRHNQSLPQYPMVHYSSRSKIFVPDRLNEFSYRSQTLDWHLNMPERQSCLNSNSPLKLWFQLEIRLLERCSRSVLASMLNFSPFISQFSRASLFPPRAELV